VDAGLAQRIELLNAFVACVHPCQDHDPAFLICKSCGTVAGDSAAVPQPSCLRCPVVSFKRAILNDPQILVLDEATQGPDQPASAAFYRLIETLRDDIGCVVLMVSHELHIVISAMDWVICLNGHFCCEGTPDVVTATAACRDLFGTGTGGALELYRHDHDHGHDHEHDYDQPHEAAN
jgi:zinc transport system ATP-binding protein